MAQFIGENHTMKIISDIGNIKTSHFYDASK